jgi:hypothetical protein
LSRQAVSSPIRLNRREVIVPFRVLSRSAVADLLVLRSRFGLGARKAPDPSGLPHTARGQGRDSLDDPLLGFNPPARYFPTASPRSFDPRHLSWGFSPLQRSRWRESTIHPVARWHPWLPRGCRRFPCRQLRCRSQVFPTSQRLLPLPAVLPCFRQVALLGFCPSGVLASHEAPTTRRRRHTLLAFLPPTGQAPVLGGDIRGRTGRYLGCVGTAPLWPSGSSSS